MKMARRKTRPTGQFLQNQRLIQGAAEYPPAPATGLLCKSAVWPVYSARSCRQTIKVDAAKLEANFETRGNNPYANQLPARTCIDMSSFAVCG
jgi:hypothetical protein